MGSPGLARTEPVQKQLYGSKTSPCDDKEKVNESKNTRNDRRRGTTSIVVIIMSAKTMVSSLVTSPCVAKRIWTEHELNFLSYDYQCYPPICWYHIGNICYQLLVREDCCKQNRKITVHLLSHLLCLAHLDASPPICP